MYSIIGSSRIRWWFEITVTANWKATGGSMKPFVAFPVVPFINHLSPLATNIETILRSCGITLLAVCMHSYLFHPSPRWIRPPPPPPWPASLLFRVKGGGPSPLFIARTWTKNSYYGVAVPREISLSSCGDRIALTKSSKGGVKARARLPKKKRENRRRQSPSGPKPIPSLSLSVVLFLAPRRDGRALVFVHGGERETQFSTDNKKQSIT